MKIRHSSVETFKNCPLKFKLEYLHEVEVVEYRPPDDPLITGSAIHKMIETDYKTGEAYYYQNYNIIEDGHGIELLKMEYLYKLVKNITPVGRHEYLLVSNDFNYQGTIDLIAPTGVNNEYDIYDFKYSNNIDGYLRSPQLHIYKYFYERLNPNHKIRSLNYIFIPRLNLKREKDEDIYLYRLRVLEKLKELKPQKITIEYDVNQVIYFLSGAIKMLNTKDYPANKNKFCYFCKFNDYCKKGIKYNMILPKNERRIQDGAKNKKLWIYGVPFCGKTTFANKFPNPLMLNTDGNIKFVDAPYIHIKDEVSATGRITERQFAWEKFKEVILELEKKQNDFKTIIIDLVEDLYEHCRLYTFEQMGISHESDDPFRSWDKVRTEFLSTIKRVLNLDYENIILISHEDSSRDITNKTGNKLTAIKPALQDKLNAKLAGMVDIVGRVVIDENDDRFLSLKSDEAVFGGGRLLDKSSNHKIKLEYEDFNNLYHTGIKQKQNKEQSENKKQGELFSVEPQKGDVDVFNVEKKDEVLF